MKNSEVAMLLAIMGDEHAQLREQSRDEMVRASVSKILGTLSAVVHALHPAGMKLPTVNLLLEKKFGMPAEISELVVDSMVELGCFEKTVTEVRFTKFPDEMPEGLRPPGVSPEKKELVKLLVAALDTLA
jgi:hypothetical protein